MLRILLRIPGVRQVVRLLASTRFVVEGESMCPYLEHGHYLLVDRLAYRLTTPSRGDVVVLRDPGQPGVDCVKRIVGLPGEHVKVEQERVMVNGQQLTETYVGKSATSETQSPSQWALGDHEYLVMGDNRKDSRDSRAFGPVDLSYIVGKAWVRYWPRDAWQRLG